MGNLDVLAAAAVEARRGAPGALKIARGKLIGFVI